MKISDKTVLKANALFYDTAKHIIRHFEGFLFDTAEYLNIRRIVSLKAQFRFFFGHFQMTVQHILPF